MESVPPEVAERAATRYVVADNGCWITKYAIQPTGYAYIGWQGRESGRVQGVPVHRAAYQHHHGAPPRPDGQLDHTCHDPAVCPPGNDCPHRACVNPAHLRDGTIRENALRSGSAAAENARKRCCPKCGAEYVTDANGRRCVPCRNAAAMARYYRDREARLVRQRARYARNRERILAQQREHRAQLRAERAAS